MISTIFMAFLCPSISYCQLTLNHMNLEENVKKIQITPVFDKISMNLLNDSKRLDIKHLSLIIPPDLVYKYHFGEICKWEERHNRSRKIPLKFRLGEYDYVKNLEGY